MNLTCSNVEYINLTGALKAKFVCLFWPSYSCSFFSHSFCSPETFWSWSLVNPGKENLINHWSNDMFHYQLCTKNWPLLCDKLCHNPWAVDIQNWQSCERIYPVCISWLSCKFADMQIDDFTSDSMTTPPTPGKRSCKLTPWGLKLVWTTTSCSLIW